MQQFLLKENTNVNVVVCHACLFVLLACTTSVKVACIHPCFFFLVGLSVCFSCFLGPIPIILTFLVCCCRYFGGHNSRVCCCFRVLLSCFWFGGIMTVRSVDCSVFLFCFAVSPPPCFRVVCPLWVFVRFFNTCGFVCFCFFLVVFCPFVVSPVDWYMWAAWNTLCVWQKSLTYSVVVILVAAPSLNPYLPSTC